jgi:hypothetical protein
MRGRNPSAAPGLEDGRGRAAIGASSFVSANRPSLSLHAINPPAACVPAAYAAPAITKFGKSSNTQLFFSVW